jgi:deoxyribodipyrimidine photo-lyase
VRRTVDVTDPRRAIAWFRRDLRLADNRVLEAATGAAERVWPVFIADRELIERHAIAPGRVAWFGANLVALDRSLGQVGSGLTVLRGEPAEALREFASSVGAQAVYAAADEDPPAVARDRRVAMALDLRLVDDQRIVPDLGPNPAGSPYTVYSPFRRALDARVDGDPRSADRRPPTRTSGAWRLAPSWATARRPFRPRSRRIRCRTRARWLPPTGSTPSSAPASTATGTSATGPISTPRPTCLHISGSERSACAPAGAAALAVERSREGGDRILAHGAATWRGELAWREFFAHVLAAHPRLVSQSYRREYDDLEWSSGAEADDAVAAWREGRTGFPFVDAGMRQLVATGWMHNRARLVTASFLVKDAGVDWRRGIGLPGASARRRRPAEQRQLAVGRGGGDRRGALLPHLQPDAAGEEVRSRRGLHPSLGAGACPSAESACPRALACR